MMNKIQLVTYNPITFNSYDPKIDINDFNVQKRIFICKKDCLYFLLNIKFKYIVIFND